MDHEAMVTIAETILSAAFPPSAQLQLSDVIQDNVTSTLLRCQCLSRHPGAPDTVIVKRPDRHEAAIFHEWAGLAFIQTRAHLSRLTPQIYGHDEPTTILVMEDLGPYDQQLLRNILMASDAERATEALLAFQRALGTLHAHTIGQHTAFNNIRSRYPNTMHSRHLVHHFDNIFDAFEGLPERLGRHTPSGFRREVKTARAALTQPGPFFALTHGDTTPLNGFYTPSGDCRLYDWEACGFRHALLDGAYTHIRYLYSVVAMDIPQHVQNRMYDAYREALLPGCPVASDDLIFEEAYLACCVAWLAGLCGFIPKVLETDEQWGTSTWRQRIMKGLRQFIDLSQDWGAFGNVGEACQDIEQVLQKQWHDTDNRLPFYPAFAQ